MWVRIVDGTAADVVDIDPHTIFVASVAEQFVEVSQVIAQGWRLVDGVWTEPEPTPEPEPVPIVIAVPQEVTVLQGLLAVATIGFDAEYSAWAESPDRSFIEKAFIEKATTWKRNNPVIQAASVALGITDEQLDQLFILAATL